MPLFVLALCPARAAGPSTDLGRRKAQLHLALPRAACRAMRWKCCSTSLVPGLSDELRAAHPRARRGRAASTRSRPSACCSTGACSSARASTYRPAGDDRDARGAGDAAGADRCPARRPLRGRAAHACRTRPCSARRSRFGDWLPSRACPTADLEPLLASLVRKEVLSLSVRSALARARPVRLPPGPREAGRLRDALPEGAQDAASRSGLVPASHSATTTRSSRCSPRTTSTPTGCAGRRGRRRIRDEARQMLVRAASGLRRSRPTRRRSDAYERAIELSDDPPCRPTCTSTRA